MPARMKYQKRLNQDDVLFASGLWNPSVKSQGDSQSAACPTDHAAVEDRDGGTGQAIGVRYVYKRELREDKHKTEKQSSRHSKRRLLLLSSMTL